MRDERLPAPHALDDAGGADAGAPASLPAPVVAEASDYVPPWWLRSPHVQTMLGSSPWRIRRGAELLAATGATTTAHVLDAGDGVRLQGLYSTPRPRAAAARLGR
jgi:hypothetical protein